MSWINTKIAIPTNLPVEYLTMGQTLTEPIRTKETTTCQSTLVKVAASCMQGWRIHMEDAHTVLLSMPGDRDCHYFGVFDGHGGGKIAQYVSQHLHKKILSQQAYSLGHISEAIKSAFLALDEELLRETIRSHLTGGTTAVMALIKGSTIYCGNVGDSRAVCSVKGVAKALSYDHKPGNESENHRIVAAGGYVGFNRVNGTLALSRALGDFAYKRNTQKKPEEQVITAYPDVSETKLTPDHEFMVLACDGIWDVLSSQDVVDFVRARIGRNMDPHLICEELLNRCLAPSCQMGGVGCDNMTAILVCFLYGGSYQDLSKKCMSSAAIVTSASSIPAPYARPEIGRFEQASTSRSSAGNRQPPLTSYQASYGRHNFR